jgi:Fic family protein
MKTAEFQDSPSGHLVPTIGGQMAFVPNSLPPSIPPDRWSEIAEPLASASLAIGELRGIGRTLTNPYLLIAPLQRKEAISSSSIEGTYTSLSELFLFEAGARDENRAPDTREVYNYVRALQTGIAQLKSLPLCLRIIREVHEILLKGVNINRGGNAIAGEFKSSQNWIGAYKIEEARYVPPPPREALGCLDALEKHIQREDKSDANPLVDAALFHYQFEAIHPFPDGNGRVGRILIPLFLMERGMMSQPLLYMSPYFESNKDEYIDRLLEVSRSGDWIPWIIFFLNGIKDSSDRTVSLIQKLQDLSVAYRSRLQKAGRSALLLKIVDLAFERPYFSISALSTALNVTYQATAPHVDTLMKEKIIQQVPNYSHPKMFVAHEIVKLISES